MRFLDTWQQAEDGKLKQCILPCSFLSRDATQDEKRKNKVIFSRNKSGMRVTIEEKTTTKKKRKSWILPRKLEARRRSDELFSGSSVSGIISMIVSFGTIFDRVCWTVVRRRTAEPLTVPWSDPSWTLFGTNDEWRGCAITNSWPMKRCTRSTMVGARTTAGGCSGWSL